MGINNGTTVVVPVTSEHNKPAIADYARKAVQWW